MKRSLSLFILLGICLVIVVLIFTHVLPIEYAAIIFALTLVTLGLLSRGFKKTK
jgi:Flp pilus assembly protein TadB